MKAVIDTNIVISGIFFGGLPAKVLQAGLNRKFEWQASPAILAEYRKTERELANLRPGLNGQMLLAAVANLVSLVPDIALPGPACDDKDDDKFLACALASGTMMVVSGDKALLRMDGYRGLRVLKVRDFLEKQLGVRI